MLTDVLGIDRGLQTRVRGWITEQALPAGQPLGAIDANLSIGHWSPRHSRFASLLDQIDLLHLPAQRLPDLASAQAAVAERGLARLGIMSQQERHRFLRGIGTVRLRNEGNEWLVDHVLSPAFCNWLAEPDYGPMMQERYPAAVQTIECTN